MAHIPNLDSAESEIISYLDSVAASLGTTINQIKAAGVPRDPKGAKTEEALMATVFSFALAVSNAKTAASNLPTDDITAFRVQADNIGKSVQASAQSASEAIAKLETQSGSSINISKAFSQSSACSNKN